MKFSVYLFCAGIFGINLVYASIWIKNIKSFGPAATIAGTRCLTTLTQYYFKSPMLARTKNLVMSYTRNMSPPAENIQVVVSLHCKTMFYFHEFAANVPVLDSRITIFRLFSRVCILEHQNFYYILCHFF